jgi:hypothetical protein
VKIAWISCEKPPVQQSELFTRSHVAREWAYSSSAALVSRQTKYVPSSFLPSMKSPKRKRISYVKAGVLMIDQVNPAILKGSAVRFDLSKG